MRYIFITDNPALIESFKQLPEKTDPCLVIKHGKSGYRVTECINSKVLTNLFGDS